MKTCYQCRERKLESEFNVNRAKKDGLNIRCRPCHRQLKQAEYASDPITCRERNYKWRNENKELKKEITKRWNAANPKKLLASKLKWHYGMSLEEYEQILKDQDSKCKICSIEPSENQRLCVDHDHVTGKIRGLLCHRCNRAIGLMKDDHHILQKAVDYLRETLATTASP